MNHFADNLRLVRKNFGWTQARAADEISKAIHVEVTENVYQSWELARVEPGIDIMLTITEVFIIDDLYLFLSKPMKVYNNGEHVTGNV